MEWSEEILGELDEIRVFLLIETQDMDPERRKRSADVIKAAWERIKWLENGVRHLERMANEGSRLETALRNILNGDPVMRGVGNGGGEK